MKADSFFAGLSISLALVSGCAAPQRSLPKATYRDKMEGAWIGQMVGVSYGAPYEFRAVGKMDDGAIRTWQPEFIVCPCRAMSASNRIM